MIRIAVIRDNEHWETYKGMCDVARNRHFPAIPPSFPVLVVTEFSLSGWLGKDAHHHFLEAAEARTLLGI